MTPARKVITLGFLVAIFAAGAGAGMALDRITRPEGPPMPPPGRSAGMLQKRLNLDEKQTAEVHAAFEELRETAEGLFRETRPRIDAATERAHSRIRAVLTPDQASAFDTMIEERRRRRPDGPPPGHPPPHRGPPPFGGPPPFMDDDPPPPPPPGEEPPSR